MRALVGGGGRRFLKRTNRSLGRANARRLLLEPLEARYCPALIVPALSSLPGASHTLYLDFDGHVTEGTSWNNYFNRSSINSPAYNTDGDATSFSAGELADIESAWRRVAEDFLPFEVNVTTMNPGIEALKRSGSGDGMWGARLVITQDNVGCGCGGIAYIDSFNWSSDTPAFVYVTGGKYVAEAASHEAGHTLGLAHDGASSTGYYAGHGSGETSWAPLMGVGYYSNVTQWDRGEYSGANNGGFSANYGKGPDDLAIITGYNGFGYRSDDHGNSAGSATPLSVAGSAISGAGIITTRGDEDYFSFTTGAGHVSLSITPAALGANLDIAATLYDTAGNLVASANPAAELDASFGLTLAAGTYYLKIDGAGLGTASTGYTDYASLGKFSISGTIVESSQAPTLSIGDVTVDETAGTASFAVTLSGSTDGPVTVDYSTSDGTAKAGSDYAAAGGTLTFLPGETTQQVTITIHDDGVSEAAESFAIRLANATGGAIIADGQAEGTILDNDAALAIGDVSIREGNPPKGKKGSAPRLTSFSFTVTLSSALATPVNVQYETRNGTALVSNNDYQSASGSLTFAPGETTKTVMVNVVADTTAEGNETFVVVLTSSSGAALADDTGAGTILDDDARTRSAKNVRPIDPNPGAVVERDLPLRGHDLALAALLDEAESGTADDDNTRSVHGRELIELPPPHAIDLAMAQWTPATESRRGTIVGSGRFDKEDNEMSPEDNVGLLTAGL